MTSTEPIEDRNLARIQPLTAPGELKTRLPITPRAAEVVLDAR